MSLASRKPSTLFVILLLAVTCSKLSPPTNGELLVCNATQIIYSTVCTFSCKEGFEGKGSVVRSCTQNGTWSGTDFVCTGNYYCLVITAYSTFQFVFYNKLYNKPRYSRILIGSRLWSIRGQTHNWRHHHKVFPSEVQKRHCTGTRSRKNYEKAVPLLENVSGCF